MITQTRCGTQLTSVLLITFCIWSGCNREIVASGQIGQAQINFLPFDHDPYTPLDVEHMDPGSFRFTVDETATGLKEALSLLDSGSKREKFDRSDVRVRISLHSGRVVAVDKHGCFADGGKKGCLEGNAIGKFQHALEKLESNPYGKIVGH